MAEERRLVAILFADVVGSTALSESMDPEDVRARRGVSPRSAAPERHAGAVATS